jgi:hypothetical protein
VEDVVNACSSQQLQAVGKPANTLQHVIRPIVLGRKLRQRPITNENLRALVEAQPNQINGSELQRPMGLVMCRLHQILSLEQPVADFGEKDVAVLQLAIDGSHARHAHLERCQRQRCPPINNSKWSCF